MSQTENEGEFCRICRMTKPEHRIAEAEGKVHHGFSPVSTKLEPLGAKGAPPDTPKRVTASTQSIGGDPVLRFALIRAGVISAEDLTSAEEELRSVGMAIVDKAIQATREEPDHGDHGH